MQITSFRVRGDDKVVLNGDDGKTYHFLNVETAAPWMAANTTNIPTLTSINPTTAVATDVAADVTVTLTGTNFNANSEVLVNNQVEASKVFVSATSMTIVIKPSLVTPPALWQISVRNGIFQTAPKPFSFTATMLDEELAA